MKDWRSLNLAVLWKTKLTFFSLKQLNIIATTNCIIEEFKIIIFSLSFCPDHPENNQLITYKNKHLFIERYEYLVLTDRQCIPNMLNTKLSKFSQFKLSEGDV